MFLVWGDWYYYWRKPTLFKSNFALCKLHVLIVCFTYLPDFLIIVFFQLHFSKCFCTLTFLFSAVCGYIFFLLNPGRCPRGNIKDVASTLVSFVIVREAVFNQPCTYLCIWFHVFPSPTDVGRWVWWRVILLRKFH